MFVNVPRCIHTCVHATVVVFHLSIVIFRLTIATLHISIGLLHISIGRKRLPVFGHIKMLNLVRYHAKPFCFCVIVGVVLITAAGNMPNYVDVIMVKVMRL